MKKLLILLLLVPGLSWGKTITVEYDCDRDFGVYFYVSGDWERKQVKVSVASSEHNYKLLKLPDKTINFFRDKLIIDWPSENKKGYKSISLGSPYEHSSFGLIGQIKLFNSSAREDHLTFCNVSLS